MNRLCSWSYLSAGTSSVFSPFPLTIQRKKIKGEEEKLYVSGKESIAAKWIFSSHLLLAASKVPNY